LFFGSKTRKNVVFIGKGTQAITTYDHDDLIILEDVESVHGIIDCQKGHDTVAIRLRYYRSRSETRVTFKGYKYGYFTIISNSTDFQNQSQLILASVL